MAGINQVTCHWSEMYFVDQVRNGGSATAMRENPLTSEQNDSPTRQT